MSNRVLYYTKELLGGLNRTGSAGAPYLEPLNGKHLRELPESSQLETPSQTDIL